MKGHALYPADITFRASREGRGMIRFTLDVEANFADDLQRWRYEHGGESLENNIWENLLRNVGRYWR